MTRLGDSGVHTLGDTSAFVNPTVQLLLTRRGNIRMDGIGIVFEFYIDHATAAYKSTHRLPKRPECGLA